MARLKTFRKTEQSFINLQQWTKVVYGVQYMVLISQQVGLQHDNTKSVVYWGKKPQNLKNSTKIIIQQKNTSYSISWNMGL